MTVNPPIRTLPRVVTLAELSRHALRMQRSGNRFTDHELQRACDLTLRGLSPNSLRSYEYGWATWQKWATMHSCSVCPADPDHVAVFLSAFADTKAVHTLIGWLYSIEKGLAMAGAPGVAKTQIIRDTVRGMTRVYGDVQIGKRPLMRDDLRRGLQAMSSLWRSDAARVRDICILTILAESAMRRSELTALQFEDITWCGDGYVINIGRSKTDTAGEGYPIAIAPLADSALDPVAAMRRWFDIHPTRRGPLFSGIRCDGRFSTRPLHPEAINRLVKECVGASGLDVRLYGAHSTRTGFVTQKFFDGWSAEDIMRVTRHKSQYMLFRYIKMSPELLMMRRTQMQKGI